MNDTGIDAAPRDAVENDRSLTPSRHSRRTFLKGIGAAALGIGALRRETARAAASHAGWPQYQLGTARRFTEMNFASGSASQSAADGTWKWESGAHLSPAQAIANTRAVNGQSVTATAFIGYEFEATGVSQWTNIGVDQIMHNHDCRMYVWPENQGEARVVIDAVVIDRTANRELGSRNTIHMYHHGDRWTGTIFAPPPIAPDYYVVNVPTITAYLQAGHIYGIYLRAWSRSTSYAMGGAVEASTRAYPHSVIVGYREE